MDTNRLLGATLAASAIGASGLAAGAGLLAGGPVATDAGVLARYAAAVPLDLAAPTWLPDGFVLLDGDGPWTRVDLDGDGTHESVRAEIMYGPADASGMAPVMTSQETGHPLESLAGGYELVTLPDGTPAWITVADDSPWVAVQWNVGDVTRGIQARDVTVDELLRIAASFDPIDTSAE